MADVSTTVDSEHKGGRTYLVTVDRHHRPAQLPRSVCTAQYADEVTTDNADEFVLLFIREEIELRIKSLFPEEQSDNMTFNEMLELLVSGVELGRKMSEVGASA